jgi:hypothetical protein
MITFSNLGTFGRLGNQLFQIAALVGYSEKYSHDILLPKWDYSKHFNCNFRQLNRNIDCVYYEKDNLNFNEIPQYESTEKLLDIVGYFQSEKYFINAKNTILKMFKIEDGVIDSGFIHIRRGDYVEKQNYHPLQSLDYYKNGMDVLNKSHYYCFSDDIGWCKENIKDTRVEFVETCNEIDTLKLMMKCSAAVIANSSFSWWGAYLGQHNNVVMPKNWFGCGYSWFNIDDRCVKGWCVC